MILKMSTLVISSLLLTAICGDSDTCFDATTRDSALVHPLVIELEKLNLDRMKAWDDGDFTKYMETAKGHEELRVEVWSEEKKMIMECNGYDDYFKQFGDVLHSFVHDRKIKGFHTMMPANYTIHVDGTVTLSVDWVYHEQSATEINAEKQWKSSGYSQFQWAPLKSGSRDIEDWRLKNYRVFMEETSPQYGNDLDEVLASE